MDLAALLVEAAEPSATFLGATAHPVVPPSLAPPDLLGPLREFLAEHPFERSPGLRRDQVGDLRAGKMVDVIEAGDPAIVVATERVVVRPWRMDEADRFFDIYRRVEVVRWLGAAPMQNRQEAVEMIDRIRARLAADSRFGSWALVDRSSGIPAGAVLLKPLPDGDGEIEIGWHLHPDSWGKGLASEAASAVLKRGFAEGIPEVWAVTHLDNHRSVAVCRRIGMRLLGVTHRWYHEPSLMFWAGCRPGQKPSLRPDEPAPSEVLG